MVKNIEELYDAMQEKIVLKIGENDEINNLWSELNKLDRLLKNSIETENYEIFDEYLEKEAELIDLERRQAFVYGFKLANKLMVESMKE
jgi:hypothetical protein